VPAGGSGATERGKLDSSSPEEFNAEQPEFGGPKLSKHNTAPKTEAGKETAAPKGPLPDLRQGIPSTFDAEFGFDASPKATRAHKTTQQENIVEESVEQPEPASGAAGSGRGSGELPKSAFETSVDRRRNRVANYSYIMALVFGITGAVYLGRPWETEEEAKDHADIPSDWSPSLMYARARARMSGQMSYYTEPTFPKLLPEMDPAPPYTLVLSLEDLLVHSDWTNKTGWRTAKRPGVDYFIRYLSQYYELVIFTSLPMQIADPVIKKLDPFHVVMWPLFREATRYEKGEYIKVRLLFPSSPLPFPALTYNRTYPTSTATSPKP
jgi:import inner membrane translocase subunit TIM50